VAAALLCAPGSTGGHDRRRKRVPRTASAISWRPAVTSRGRGRRVEIKDGERTVAAAEVTTSPGTEGTARASLHAMSGHVAPGNRARLVDAVMDLPEVQDSAHLAAAVPLGDTESLQRLRERALDVTTRPAGSTALVDADVPPGRESGSGRELDDEPGA